MLIKLQKHRFSPEYMIFDNVTCVGYRNVPHLFHKEEELLDFMHGFMAKSRTGDRETWYCIWESGSGSDKPARWPDGYKINRVTFLQPNNTPVEIVFDGEAFICNDDGKTVQKIKVGGAESNPPAISEPAAA